MAKATVEPPPIELDDTDLLSIREAAARLVGLCVIELDAGLEEMVGQIYIQAALPSASTQHFDGRIVAPEAGAWRTEEIDEHIIGPSNRAPMVCNVVVVCSADTLTSAGRDRILKTLEEPAARTSFCFLVRDRGALGPTILGRAGAACRVHSSDLVLRTRLIERGVDPVALEAHGEAWGSFLGLLDSVEDTGDVEDLLAGSEAWRSATPMATGAKIALILDGIGKDPGSKRRARVLCGAWLGAMAASVRREVASGGLDSLRGERLLASQTGARDNLAYNSPLGLVVARALAGRG